MFSIHISVQLITLSIFSFFIFYLYILFSEMSLQICPFLLTSLLSYNLVVKVLDMHKSSVGYIFHKYVQSVTCLFFSITVCFNEQVFISRKSNL